MLLRSFARITGTTMVSAALLAGLPGLGGLAGATSPRSSARPTSQVSQTAAVARQVLADLRVGSPNLPGLTKTDSLNWAGYVDDNSRGNTYTAMTGKWTQPTIECARSTDLEIAAFWVGLDGWGSSTVEQDGTLGMCDDGAISYYDWWEMYPSNSIQLDKQISASDVVTSSIAFASGEYRLTVTDHTHRSDSFTQVATCGSTPCKDSTAEWIAERPGTGSGFVVLPNFGKWKVSRASVTSGTKSVISGFADDAINMVSSTGTSTLVTVSALNAKGAGFTATWRRSA